MGRDARICVAFTSARLSGSSQSYPLHHPTQKLLSNEAMLNEIRRPCQGVEFIGTTEVEKPRYAVGNIQARRR